MPTTGTTAQRGYSSAHQRLRKRYEPLVRSGRAHCPRCGHAIAPTAAWDLGHDDSDPTHRRYTGPEHEDCNRRAGALKAHSNRKAKAGPAADNTRCW